VSQGSSSGVWLVLRPAPDAVIALPVPRQACLGLTRAVLAADPSEESSSSAIVPDRWWASVADDPASAAWLAAVERGDSASAGDFPSASPPARREPRFESGRLELGAAADSVGRTSLLARLESDLRTGLEGDAGSSRGGICVDPDLWKSVWENVWERMVRDVPRQEFAEAAVGRRFGQAVLEELSRSTQAGLQRERQFLKPPGSTAAGGRPTGESLPMEPILLMNAIARGRELERLQEGFGGAVIEARLESIRELAYGAGHEINNPLANIATRAQALLLEERDVERRRRLATIVDQAFRARDMIGGLMLFARPPKPQPAANDVHAVIASVIESLHGQAAGRGVRLEYSPPPVPVSAWVDRGQIEEALRAIGVNAVEAVADGGRVRFGAGLSVHSGRSWCEIVVEDDGRGMDRATLRRAFDPFFCGREAGRGAGLGLSKAWRFVDACGGGVVVESRPEEGARVSMLLPLTEEAAAGR